MVVAVVTVSVPRVLEAEENGTVLPVWLADKSLERIASDNR